MCLHSILDKSKKLFAEIPSPLYQCFVTFLFIPISTTISTTLCPGKEVFTKTLGLNLGREKDQMSQLILKLGVCKQNAKLFISKATTDKNKIITEIEIEINNEMMCSFWDCQNSYMFLGLKTINLVMYLSQCKPRTISKRNFIKLYNSESILHYLERSTSSRRFKAADVL